MWSLLFVASVHSQKFTFGAAGDFSTGANFLSTLDAIKTANVDLMLALGDLAYEDKKEDWWCEQWRNRTSLSDLLIVAGSSDVDNGGTIQPYVQACPSFLPVTGVAGIQYYLDFPVGTPLARFIMITPGVGGSAAAYNTYGRNGTGLSWVASTIDSAREAQIPWIVVGMSKNYISTLGSSDEVGEPLMSLLFQKKVDLVLQANEPGYERSKQLTCATAGSFNSSCVYVAQPAEKAKGSTIVILGTGGKDLAVKNSNDSESGYFQVVNNRTYGFGHFLVTADRLTYNFRRSAGGDLRDSFTLTTAARPVVNETASPTPEKAVVVEVNNFDYAAPGIIAIIGLFLICMAVTAVIAVFMLIRSNHAHAAPVVEGLDKPKVKNIQHESDEGTIDYL